MTNPIDNDMWDAFDLGLPKIEPPRSAASLWTVRAWDRVIILNDGNRSQRDRSQRLAQAIGQGRFGFLTDRVSQV